ncbi:MAG: Ferrichrome outer membrane transporter/phage receptor [Candidatus Erwinia impunctatus]|nr:Ferrichrome outer membrane transporter/phage receptor [Culicoides impunctatus]
MTIAFNSRVSVFSRRQLAVLIALILTPSAFAAEQTLVVEGSGRSDSEQAWGPAPTIAAKKSATGTKTDTPIEKFPSLCLS